MVQDQVEWKMLKKGDRGSNVLNLQQMLSQVMSVDFTPNGIFGPKTDAAVRAFQKANGLTVDGKVGIKTYAVLADLVGTPEVEPANEGDYFIGVEHLQSLGVSAAKSEEVLDPLNKAIVKYNLITVNRMAAFVANIVHESGAFEKLSENLNYSAKRLAAVWPKRFGVNGAPNELACSIASNPEAIANNVYANRMGNGDVASGDGWLYRGRGPIGITGKAMYRKCGEAIGVDLVANPELLEQPTDACFESAAWYFQQAGCIKHADVGNFDGVCDLINIGRATPKVGDAIGYSERYALYKKLRQMLSA